MGSNPYKASLALTDNNEESGGLVVLPGRIATTPTCRDAPAWWGVWIRTTSFCCCSRTTLSYKV